MEKFKDSLFEKFKESLPIYVNKIFENSKKAYFDTLGGYAITSFITEKIDYNEVGEKMSSVFLLYLIDINKEDLLMSYSIENYYDEYKNSLDQKDTLIDIANRIIVKYFKDYDEHQEQVKKIKQLNIDNKISENIETERKSIAFGFVDLSLNENIKENACSLRFLDNDIIFYRTVVVNENINDFNGILDTLTYKNYFNCIEDMFDSVSTNVFNHHAIKYNRVYNTDGEKTEFYITSMKDYEFGSIALINKELQADISDRFGGDFYVTVMNDEHLMISAADVNLHDFEKISKILRTDFRENDSKNETTICKRLPDTVYKYDSATNELTYTKSKLQLVKTKSTIENKIVSLNNKKML